MRYNTIQIRNSFPIFIFPSKYPNNLIFIFPKALKKRMENEENQYLKSLKNVLLVVIGCEFLRFYLIWETHYASIISLLFKDWITSQSFIMLGSFVSTPLPMFSSVKSLAPFLFLVVVSFYCDSMVAFVVRFMYNCSLNFLPASFWEMDVF